MSKKPLVTMLADRNGVFEHMVIHTSQGGRRCYCTAAVHVDSRRIAYCPFTQVLTCQKCDRERLRWLSWWESVERREREHEEGKSEEGYPSA